MAKTVGEALKNCKPADLLWEYERGYLKVLGGPMADVPACMAPPSKDPTIQILAKFRGPNGCSIKMNPEVRKKTRETRKAVRPRPRPDPRRGGETMQLRKRGHPNSASHCK